MKNYLIIQYDLHHKLYNNVLEGFTDEETNERVHGDKNMNHMKYLAGHLLNSQYALGTIAGIDPEVKWNELFAAMNQSEAKDDIEYPSIEEIKAEWNAMNKPIRNGLNNLTTELLENKPPEPFDKVAESTGQLWAFLNHHQAYHIGQIGILRRGFDKAPMRYD